MLVPEPGSVVARIFSAIQHWLPICTTLYELPWWSCTVSMVVAVLPCSLLFLEDTEQGFIEMLPNVAVRVTVQPSLLFAVAE